MKGKGKKAKVTSMKGKGGTFRHRVQETEKKKKLKEVTLHPNLDINFSRHKVDELGMGLLPSDVQGLPENVAVLKSSPNGNCLFNSE